MTVAAYVYNAINDEEKSIYIPVSAESFFVNRWLPIASEFSLELVPLFSNGLDVDIYIWPDLKKELDQIVLWCTSNKADKQYSEHLHDRASRLIQCLDGVFEREDAIVFIG
jgi:hypothetical protein